MRRKPFQRSLRPPQSPAVGDAEARRALALGFADFEDAMQTAAAEACAAEVLVTRDPKGFTQSLLAVLSPEEFLLRHSAPA